MPYWVEIEVTNQKNKPYTFTIPKGRMISPKNINSKVQNLVVTDDHKVTVPAKGKVVVTIPTECTDPHYPYPSNTTMDITTFGQRQRSQTNIFPGRTM